MGKENTKINQDTLTRVVCTFVFTLFAFFYLYYYQADLLTVMQHVFSKGQTHYNHVIGAILITLVLLLLQVGVVNACRKVRVAWALTFVPSAMCLMALTDVQTSVDSGLLEFGKCIYGLPVALLLFGAIVWGLDYAGVSAALSTVIKTPLRNMWVNLVVMFASILSVCLFSNSDKVYHMRIHTEQALIDNDLDEALHTIKRLDVADKNMTMLTAYTLSRKGKLAESLFEYPLTGGADALMPDGNSVKFEILPDSTFYLYLGGWYVQRMRTMKYLDYQRRHKRLNKQDIDYLLCGYLLNKNLDAFVDNIGKYYVINDSVALPKHYKEALLMYTHMHSNPKIIYSNNVMNADFQDYQSLEKKYADKRERQTALRETYGNTYWYYYQY